MNICVRIFQEQMDLINQLPINERAVVLYHVVNDTFNQIDNQIDFQNVSLLGQSVYKLLRKNVVRKEFSPNYGGLRKGAGRPVSVGDNQIDFQTDNQTGNQVRNQNESAYISVSVSDSVSNSVSEKNITKKSSSLQTTRVNTPTLKEVLAYAREQDSTAGMGGFACTRQIAEEFWANYESNGWVVSNECHTPIRNWKAKLRQWAVRNMSKINDDGIPNAPKQAKGEK